MRRHPGSFPRAGPRADRCRAGNARADLVRTLLAQNAQGPHRVHRRRRLRPPLRQSAEGNDLRGDARNSPPPRRRRLVRQRLRGQRRRRAASTTIITFASRWKRITIRRRSSRTAAPTPAWAASSAIRSAPAWEPSPICNTDVFCFAPPDTPPESLPPGVLHPLKVMKGVVAGVRDYGNRMGIPTVNGAVLLRRALPGQPAGLLRHRRPDPRGSLLQSSRTPGDLIVAVGGRTGRDGIHGATFSVHAN